MPISGTGRHRNYTYISLSQTQKKDSLFFSTIQHQVYIDLKQLLFVYIVLCAHSLVQTQKTGGASLQKSGQLRAPLYFYHHGGIVLKC